MKAKIFAIAVLISIAPALAQADALFEGAYLSDLRVVNVDAGTGWALIQNGSGAEKDVFVGEFIGWERAEVVTIEKAAIIVEQDDLRTRIPILDPFSGN